jgi:predicted aspartyl protease
MRELARLALAVVVFGLGSCAMAPQDYETYAPKRTTLATSRVVLPSYKSQNGRLYVQALINGAGPFLLLVDSGSTSLVLKRRAADASHVTPLANRAVMVTNAYGDVSRSSVGWVETLDSGGLGLRGVVATIIDDDAIPGIQSREGMDGVLGMVVFAGLVLEMDFPAGRVAVSRGGPPWMSEWMSGPYDAPLPIVAAWIADARMPMLIDTGYDGLFELPKLDSFPLVYAKRKWSGAVGVFGTTSEERPEVSQLDGEIRIGAVSWVNPPVVEASHERARMGLRAVNRWTLVFDNREGRVYFLGGEGMVWDRRPRTGASGAGVFVRIQEGELRVEEVDAGGAAESAGLKTGDVIVAMNGRPGLAPDFLLRPTRLRVRRNGSEFDTTLDVPSHEAAEADRRSR